MPQPIRTPRGPGWLVWPDTQVAPLPRGAGRFIYPARDESSAVLVVSSLDDIIERGPTWHVSISWMVRRGELLVPQHASDEHVALALRAFRMEGAEEDNSASPVGGVARHFWRDAGPSRRTLTRERVDA